MKKKIILKRLSHREERRLAIYFNYDVELTSLVRKISGATWSKSMKCWHANDDEEALKQILQVFREKADIDISSLTHQPDSDDSIPAEKSGRYSGDSLVGDFLPEPTEADNEESKTLPLQTTIKKIIDRERFSPVELSVI